MLPELHQVLKELIHSKGQINPSEVDVSFEVPSKEWADKLVRPTVNLYLFELQENTELRHAQFKTTQSNGFAQFHAPPKRVDVRYIVTAITTDSDDAYRLLWRVLGVLMRAPELEPALFPDGLKLEAQVVTKVAYAESGIKLLDVWSALSTEPRAAFCYVVTLPVDMDIVSEPFPFVASRSYGYRSLTEDGGPESRSLIRGFVRDAAGTPLENVTVATLSEPIRGTRTNAEGAFTLQTPKSDRFSVRVTRPNGQAETIDLQVSAPSFDLVLK